MYLVDTDVISNARKRTGANPGVRRFFQDAATRGIPLFLSAVTIGVTALSGYDSSLDRIRLESLAT